MDVRLLFPSLYINAADIAEAAKKTGRDGFVLTVARVTVDNLETNKGQEKKPVVYFSEMEKRSEQGKGEMDASGHLIDDLCRALDENFEAANRIERSISEQARIQKDISICVSSIIDIAEQNATVSSEVKDSTTKLHKNMEDLLKRISAWQAPEMNTPSV